MTLRTTTIRLFHGLLIACLAEIVVGLAYVSLTHSDENLSCVLAEGELAKLKESKENDGSDRIDVEQFAIFERTACVHSPANALDVADDTVDLASALIAPHLQRGPPRV